MGRMRAATAAGSFYPADPQELRSQVAGLLSAEPPAAVGVTPRILVAPHAGYIYSGSIAAAAYRLLGGLTPACHRFVVIGPSHFVPFSGMATPGVDRLATPLGAVPVDTELADRAERHPGVVSSRSAHTREHSLEVQLPFLQVAAGDVAVLALATGDARMPRAAAVLGGLLDGDVIAVVSTDLSHYLTYAAAVRQDETTAAAIRELRAEDISPGDACGRIALQAGLTVARERGWHCEQLALLNSGDTAGSRSRVVGYGAFVLGPAA